MNKELLKKFLNHSISKSDGKINISVLDMQSELFVLQNKDTCVTLIELI